MRMFKKGVRLIIKSLAVLVFVGVLYSIHLQMIANQVIGDPALMRKSEQEFQLKEPNVIEIEDQVHDQIDLPSVDDSQINDFTFEERDMLDENGRQFKIIVWIKHVGKPGYLANPQECLGNISCQVVYPSPGAEKSAHAIVFKADHMHGSMPSTR